MLLQLGLPLQHEYFGNSRDLDPLYFGAMYAVSAGWYGLASRDRRKRFRLVPIGLTALLAVLLTPLWPYQRLDGVAVAAIIACTVQIVSPWSEQGSRYAKYVRYVQKQKRNRQDRLSTTFFLWRLDRREWTETGADAIMKRALLFVLLVMMLAWFATTRHDGSAIPRTSVHSPYSIELSIESIATPQGRSGSAAEAPRCSGGTG